MIDWSRTPKSCENFADTLTNRGRFEVSSMTIGWMCWLDCEILIGAIKGTMLTLPALLPSTAIVLGQ